MDTTKTTKVNAEDVARYEEFCQMIAQSKREMVSKYLATELQTQYKRIELANEMLCNAEQELGVLTSRRQEAESFTNNAEQNALEWQELQQLEHVTCASVKREQVDDVMMNVPRVEFNIVTGWNGGQYEYGSFYLAFYRTHCMIWCEVPGRGFQAQGSTEWVNPPDVRGIQRNLATYAQTADDVLAKTGSIVEAVKAGIAAVSDEAEGQVLQAILLKRLPSA